MSTSPTSPNSRKRGQNTALQPPSLAPAPPSGLHKIVNPPMTPPPVPKAAALATTTPPAPPDRETLKATPDRPLKSPQTPASIRKRKKTEMDAEMSAVRAAAAITGGAAPPTVRMSQATSIQSPIAPAAATSADNALSQADLPAPKRTRTNTPWTPAEERRLKVLRDAGSSWGEIAKEFPHRTEGSVKKHWYKDMHYADFAEDESAALLAAIREYEANKWKEIGKKVGKPAKACEQYAKEHFQNRL